MLKRLVKYNTEAHESAAKAGKELMGLLEYFPISAWLQVADTTTRPLVYVQVPEVVEIVKEAQVVIDKKKLKEGESPIKEIVMEQNLSDMVNLKHVWGYGKDDVRKKNCCCHHIQIPQGADVSKITHYNCLLIGEVCYNQ